MTLWVVVSVGEKGGGGGGGHIYIVGSGDIYSGGGWF